MKITHTDRKDIVVAIQSGSSTVADLGKKYDVTPGRIAAIYRKETGSYVRPGSKPVRRFSLDEKETIVAEIQTQKATMTELAKRYGVSIAAIGYIFKTVTGNGLMRQLSSSDRQAIVAQLQSGEVTIHNLAAKYGVHSGTISRNFKQVTGRAFIPQLSLHAKEAIVTELQSGNATIGDLAGKYGVHKETISKTFKRITGTSLHPRRVSPQDKKAIVAELQSGKKQIELALKYGVSSGRIGQIYKEVTGNVWRMVKKHSQADKEAIVAALQANKATMVSLAAKYGVDQPAISRLFKDMTGSSFARYKASHKNKQVAQQKNKRKMKRALHQSQYRAWHKEEKNMHPVLGIDWFSQKVLIATTGAPEWYAMKLFILMKYSGLRDRKRILDFPEGQKIYVGDIVRFPILQDSGNGETQKTMHTDVVAFDKETGYFIFVGLDGDTLALYSDECEVIGNICANPGMVSKELYELWCAVNGGIHAVDPSYHEHYNQ